MCIIIRQGDVAYPPKDKKFRSNQKGFTLPEILVSLCILFMLMQSVWQWGAVMLGTANRMEENDTAVLLAQQYFAGLNPQCPDGWHADVQTDTRSAVLQETTVTIWSNHRSWDFYYAGPTAEQEGL